VPYDRPPPWELFSATVFSNPTFAAAVQDLPGVIRLRDMETASAWSSASTSYKNAVVIVGGLLVLEAANGRLKRGMTVTVVALLDTLRSGSSIIGGRIAAQCARERGMVVSRCPRIRTILVGPLTACTLRGEIFRRPGRDCGRHPPNINWRARPGLLASVSSSSPTHADLHGRIYAVGECVQHRRQTKARRSLVDQAMFAPPPRHDVFATYDWSVVSDQTKVTGIDLSPPALRAGADKERSSCRTLPRRLQADHSARQEDHRAVLLRRHIDGPLVLPLCARTTFSQCASCLCSPPIWRWRP